MADTAAFFAKKKKKKAFKFNANKVDPSQVTSTVHVDAPAVSSELESMTISNQSNTKDTNSDWADNTQEIKIQRVVVAASNGGPSELLDMTALDKKRNEEDDIAERLRVEETKAQLAAAREGMEKEAARLKVEKTTKEAKLQANGLMNTGAGGPSRFGAAAVNVADGGAGVGGKWVPRHLRNAPPSGRAGLGGSMGMGSRSMGMGSSGSASGFQRKVDTNDENLFPDLATADKLIAKEEESKLMAARRAKGPAWPVKPTPAPAKPVPPVEETPAPIMEEKKEIPKETPAPSPAPAVTAKSAPSVAAGLKKKKKKKKDLSTFKS